MRERIMDTVADNCLLVFFMAVYLAAWTSNALLKTALNLDDLKILALAVSGQSMGYYGIASVFNSPRGVAPGRSVTYAAGKSGNHPDDG